MNRIGMNRSVMNRSGITSSSPCRSPVVQVGTQIAIRWNNGPMSPRSTIAEIDAAVAGGTLPCRFLELVASDRSLPLFHSMAAGGGWNVSTVGDVEAAAARIAAGLQRYGRDPG